MAAESSRKIYRPLLILLALAIPICGGAIAAWRAINRVTASEIDFSTEDVPTTESSLGPLMGENVSVEIGDMVFLNHVGLDVGPKPDLFVVSGSKGVRMLVTIETDHRPSLPLPRVVDVKGIVRRLPAPRILRKEWMMSKEEIDRFEREGVYIAAASIRSK